MSDSVKFQSVCDSAEVVEGRGHRQLVDDVHLAIFRHDGELFALDEMCTHADASLAFGDVVEGRVLCPWHYAEFDLQSGEALTGPACEAVKTYPIREVDGMIEVAV